MSEIINLLILLLLFGWFCFLWGGEREKDRRYHLEEKQREVWRVQGSQEVREAEQKALQCEQLFHWKWLSGDGHQSGESVADLQRLLAAVREAEARKILTNGR